MAADFNGDQAIDVATANFSADTVTIQYNDGNGNFDSLDRFFVGGQPTSITATDLDEDGRIDFATTSSTNQAINIFMSK